MDTEKILNSLASNNKNIIIENSINNKNIIENTINNKNIIENTINSNVIENSIDSKVENSIDSNVENSNSSVIENFESNIIENSDSNIIENSDSNGKTNLIHIIYNDAPPHSYCGIKNCECSFAYHPASKYWHPTKNKHLMPGNFMRTSKENAFFICKNCNHDIELKIFDCVYGRAQFTESQERFWSWLDTNKKSMLIIDF